MSLPNRMAFANLVSSDTPSDCFHCDRHGPSIDYCKLWRAWICKDCQARYHRSHHATCDAPPPMTRRAREQRLRTYTVCLTRSDGQRIYIVCRLGQKLRMQDHPEGTYLFASHGVTLVTESRAAINDRIVQGLGAVAKPEEED